MGAPYLLPLTADDEDRCNYIEFGGQYLSLRKLADEHGMDYSYLWRIFNGRRTPSVDYSLRLATLLNMTLDQFFEAIRAINPE